MQELNVNRDRWAKLPRWAQYDLDLMDRRLNEAWKQIDGLRDGYPGSRVFIEHFQDSDQTLNPNANVSFVMNDGSIFEVSIRGGGSELTVYGRGATLMAVRPQSSNVINVIGVDR